MDIEELKEIHENIFNYDYVTLKVALKSAIDQLENIQWWEGVYDDKPLTKEQIANELKDYHFVLRQVPVVYNEVTGGKMSKPNYYAEDVIREFNDYVDQRVREELEYYNKNPEELMDLIDGAVP
ncbi:hypothetical protein [Caulobacter phage Cr30]|uniref:hypothetical protein n=1 Tax=Caulobacter phage Cr30 TaxID=1357714 RepID=UPI0004A9B51E|nr:hypothetical protein OZ74_gp109 [Caulobacter phage Cr30]AGS80994.1 hypothetical protein [Caulobacter phage Cr30]